jgi:hypothetical protein
MQNSPADIEAYFGIFAETVSPAQFFCAEKPASHYKTKGNGLVGRLRITTMDVGGGLLVRSNA